MVDPVFKAPPPPMTPPAAPESSEQSAPVAENVSPNPTDSSAAGEQKPLSKKEQIMNRLNELKEQMIRYFWYSMGGLFLLGAFFGCAMSGSSSTPQQAPVPTGISKKVISNRDIKERLGICGSVAQSRSCLFYVLNNTSYDRVAEDFFEQVSRATGRSDFNIRLDNPLYQKQPIKPGYFAEIIVPAN